MRSSSPYGLTSNELKILRRLDTPEKIQNFLDTLPINFEEKGNTCMSPRRVLRERKAHCVEGALLAAAAFLIHGERPLLLDLKTNGKDDEHVVALFKRRGRWGGISKTNHAVLRYREPVYKTIRELALSYFHEYFTAKGEKVMVSFSSRPFSLLRYRAQDWVTAEKNLWFINRGLDRIEHTKIIPRSHRLRRADPIEIQAGELREWRTSHSIMTSAFETPKSYAYKNRSQ